MNGLSNSARVGKTASRGERMGSRTGQSIPAESHRMPLSQAGTYTAETRYIMVARSVRAQNPWAIPAGR